MKKFTYIWRFNSTEWHLEPKLYSSFEVAKAAALVAKDTHPDMITEIVEITVPA